MQENVKLTKKIKRKVVCFKSNCKGHYWPIKVVFMLLKSKYTGLYYVFIVWLVLVTNITCAWIG